MTDDIYKKHTSSGEGSQKVARALGRRKQYTIMTMFSRRLYSYGMRNGP